MDSIFEKDYNLRTNDFDRYNRIHPASILDLFQDVAGAHAVQMGIGYDSMITNKLVWVLVKVKFQILRAPKMYEHVTVRTWPLAPSKLSFQREYLILDDDGDIIVKGTSEWVVMHSEKRRLVSAIEAYPVKEGFATETLFDEKLTKIPMFEDIDTTYTLIPGFSDCDINGHVNNTKYANYVLNAVNPDESQIIDTLHIDFHREVTPGNELTVSVKYDDSQIYAKGESGDGVKNFSCHITLK